MTPYQNRHLNHLPMTDLSSSASLFSALAAEDKRVRSKIDDSDEKGAASTAQAGKSYTLAAKAKGSKVFQKGPPAFSNVNDVVKISYVPTGKDSSRHIIQYVDYIKDREKGPGEKDRQFFDVERNDISRTEVIKEMLDNRGQYAAMFKLIMSPGENDLNRQLYTREIFARYESITGRKLIWYGVEHTNTDHHHSHPIVAGRTRDGLSIKFGKADINLLRELGREYSMELRFQDYHYEKDIQREFNIDRDAEAMALERPKDYSVMKELGLYNPQLDRAVADLRTELAGGKPGQPDQFKGYRAAWRQEYLDLNRALLVDDARKEGWEFQKVEPSLRGEYSEHRMRIKYIQDKLEVQEQVIDKKWDNRAKVDPKSVLLTQAREIVQELGYRKTFPEQTDKASVTSNSEKEVFDAYIMASTRELDLLQYFQNLSLEIEPADFKELRQELKHYYPDLHGTISDLRSQDMTLLSSRKDAYFNALEEGDRSVPHYRDLPFPDTILGRSLSILHYFEWRLETQELNVPSSYSENRSDCRLARFSDEQLLVLLDKSSSLLNKEDREQFQPTLAAVYDKLSDEIALLAPEMEQEKDLVQLFSDLPEGSENEYDHAEYEIDDRSVGDTGYERTQEPSGVDVEDDRDKEDDER